MKKSGINHRKHSHGEELEVWAKGMRVNKICRKDLIGGKRGRHEEREKLFVKLASDG